MENLRESYHHQELSCYNNGDFPANGLARLTHDNFCYSFISTNPSYDYDQKLCHLMEPAVDDSIKNICSTPYEGNYMNNCSSESISLNIGEILSENFLQWPFSFREQCLESKVKRTALKPCVIKNIIYQDKPEFGMENFQAPYNFPHVAKPVSDSLTGSENIPSIKNVFNSYEEKNIFDSNTTLCSVKRDLDASENEEKYWKRRKKNNAAARKSRNARKNRFAFMEKRIKELEVENAEQKKYLNALKQKLSNQLCEL